MQAAPFGILGIFGVLALIGIVVAVALMFFKGGNNK